MKYRTNYDADRHKKYEPTTINTFLQIFTESKKWNVIPEHDKYNYDMKIKNIKTGKICLLEFETRSRKHFDNIKNKIYPDVHVPIRKMANNNIADMYIITNIECTECLITKMKNIIEAFENGQIYEDIPSKSGKNDETQLDSYVWIEPDKFKHFKILQNGTVKKIK